MKKLFISGMLCLSIFMATAQTVTLDKTVVSANCWATNPVIATSTQQNAIAVYQNFVYLTYYDATTRKLTIARNNNNGIGSNWVYVELPHTYEQRNGTWDNHNTPNIIVSPNDGRIHLAFDMHAGDLRYIISSPGAATVSDANFNASLFGPTQNYLQSNQTLIDRVTYPRFFVGDANKLFFMYRDGGSGNGHTFLVKYRDDGFWDAPVKIIDANWNGSTRCAYFNDVNFKDGRIYLTWVWRESPDGATNHDLMFMYSDDNGVTWKNSAGSTQALPVNVGNTSIIVSNISQDSGLANHNGCAVDGNGNVHVVLRHGSNYVHHIGMNNGAQFSWSDQVLATFTGDRPKIYADRVTNDLYFLVRQGSNNSLRLFETPANGGLFNQWSEIHNDVDSYMTSANSVMTASGDRLMSMTVSNDNRLQLLNWNFGAPANNPPSVSITSPTNGASFNDGDVVSITADATDSDGTVSQVEFFVNGGSVGIDTSSPYSINWTIGIGSYDISAVATDNELATTSSSVITVTGNGTSTPTESYVNSIVTGTQNVGQGYKHGEATVTILDNIGNPVAGASVTGTFSGTFNETVNGSTGADGTVTLLTSSTAKGGVTVNFCVDNVTHVSLTYNSSLNVITCTGSGGRFSNGLVTESGMDKVSLYPNPTTDRLYISLSEKNTTASFKVFNLLGHIVLDGELPNALNALEVDHLPAGFYTVQILYNGSVENLKVMIKR